ncbi:unnamed protein product, partial [Didymodactylos carnosus]
LFEDHIENTVVGICLFTVAVLLYYLIRRSTRKAVFEPKPRFRKRDKFLYYGKRFLRTMRSYSSTANNRIRRRTRRFQQQKLRSDAPTTWQPRQPPEFLLETDFDFANGAHRGEYMLPPEMLYLLKSVKVFGHFERPLFLELCKYLESKVVVAGSYLFRIGDDDNSMYVVQKGLLHVFITDEKHHRHLIKECVEGDTVFSLLSIVDVLTGHSNPFQTVSCKAIEDSVVLKLPAIAFIKVFKEYPECIVRIIQILMIRLQHVTFLALHNYLGLTTELTNLTSIPAESGTNANNHHQHHCSHFRHQTSRTHPKDNDSKTPTSAQNNLMVPPRERKRSTDSVDALLNNGDHDSNNMKKSLQTVQGVSSEMHTKLKENNQNTDQQSSSSNTLENDNQQLNQLAVLAAATQTAAHASTLTEATKAIADAVVTEASVLKDSTSTSMKKESFQTKRSMSLMDDVRRLKPDFEEAAARARVKNSLDKTIFEKQKKSYPYISKVKASTGRSKDATARRSSYLEHEYGNSYSRSYGTGSDSTGSEYNERSDDMELRNEWPTIRQALATVLGLEGDVALLDDKVHLHRLPDSHTLAKEGVMFIDREGEISGLVSALTGEPTLFTYRTRGPSDICAITKENFYDLMRMQPNLVLPVAAMMVKRMSPLVRQIDFALEWMLVEAGKSLYRQDCKPQSVYIILNGRVRSVLLAQDKKRKELVGEYGRGEMVGIVEVLMEVPRQSTTLAIRDTELAVIPTGLLNYIKWRQPQIVSRLINVLSQKIYGTLQNTLTNGVNLTMPPVDEGFQDRSSTLTKNLSTVAIVAISEDVPLDAFTCELVHSLLAIGPTLHLTEQLIIDRFGESALESINDYRLSAWLGQQEELHKIVVYQCDKKLTQWTRRSLRQADCILIVGNGWNEPTKGAVENEIERSAVRAQKELILLHRIDSQKPKGTARWLNIRQWITFHHHIRCPDRMFKYSIESDIQSWTDYSDLLPTEPDSTSDFARMARFLTGTAIGLVLGGGGARGCAHVGMIQAMHEANIPIDLIGGTSIGALMGALWADELNIQGYVERAKDWCGKMTSVWRKLIDLTYPITSMFTGATFNEIIEEALPEVQIEDLWIPYFCVTTDISASKMRVHTSGSLWRYVRASMSLSGYFPPLCDPDDGHLLLDGGYVNNLPAHTVIAVDVGSQDEQNFCNFGDRLSGWWLLYKRWNPWTTPVKVPDLSEIQTRLAYVSCQRQLELVKTSNFCEYIRPPIDRYRTLQFGSFDEIREVGYHHGRAIFHGWSKLESYDAIFLKQKPQSFPEKQARLRKQDSTGSKFIDLAELITRVREPASSGRLLEEDEDDYDTSTTEDSHLSFSSTTKGRTKRSNRTTTRIGGLRRHKARVVIRSRPETPVQDSFGSLNNHQSNIEEIL